MQISLPLRTKLFAFLFGVVTLFSPFAFANAASVTIQSLSPTTGAAAPGSQISFTASPAGFTGTVNYTVSDSFGGTTVSNAAIGSSGVFIWNPAISDIGTHNLTITATDSSSNSASVQQQIVVLGTPSVAIQSLSPSSSVLAGQTVTFSTNATSFVNPTYTVSDSFGGTSVTSSSINSTTGAFTWIPTAADAGTHTITVNVSDSGGRTGSASQSITVNGTAGVSIQSVSPSAVITAGQMVTFNTTTSGFVNPITYNVSDSFSGTTISNANINSSGTFTWVPGINQVGTHTLTVRAIDNAGHNQTAAVTLTVLNVPNPGPVNSVGLTQTQINSVIAMLQSFGVSSTVIANVNVTLSGQTPTPPPSSGYVFTLSLAVGSQGNEVTQLQTRLTALGHYSGPITGYYGSLTQAAVIRFQAARGIAQLGIVGPMTRAALNQ